MDADLRYAVAVGGNRGEVAATLDRAADLLMADGLVRVVARSTLHRTAAVGGPRGQGDFLNGAWIVATDLGPHQLLHRLQAVESACGRTRMVTWGPRTCDLDLLLAEDGRRCASPVLTLPHPRLHERAFVLAPLAEIAPGWVVPGRGTVAGLAAALFAPSFPVAPVKA
jgi:2-amino-4-hydroxy-6-hydroxymethyldihydropteridine diphosphokinase